jgi:hypothetical protein
VAVAEFDLSNLMDCMRQALAFSQVIDSLEVGQSFDAGCGINVRRIRSGYVMSAPGVETKTKSSVTAALRYYSQLMIILEDKSEKGG